MRPLQATGGALLATDAGGNTNILTLKAASSGFTASAGPLGPGCDARSGGFNHAIRLSEVPTSSGDLAPPLVPPFVGAAAVDNGGRDLCLISPLVAGGPPADDQSIVLPGNPFVSPVNANNGLAWGDDNGALPFAPFLPPAPPNVAVLGLATGTSMRVRGIIPSAAAANGLDFIGPQFATPPGPLTVSGVPGATIVPITQPGFGAGVRVQAATPVSLLPGTLDFVIGGLQPCSATTETTDPIVVTVDFGGFVHQGLTGGYYCCT